LYEHADEITDDTIAAYLAPVVEDDSTMHALERFLLGLEHDQLEIIEPKLRELAAPTLIAWGTADTTFDVKHAYWLAETLPGARPVVEVEGARLFWPEEHPDRLADLLVEHWSQAS
jgi:pimeloyl-ACP methyl ester carboxylesterase